MLRNVFYIKYKFYEILLLNVNFINKYLIKNIFSLFCIELRTLDLFYYNIFNYLIITQYIFTNIIVMPVIIDDSRDAINKSHEISLIRKNAKESYDDCKVAFPAEYSLYSYTIRFTIAYIASLAFRALSPGKPINAIGTRPAVLCD